ncbi:hypothetical protein HYPSUDRAFT_208404 [Hypholoma sublateritium FD-334 SS-4]|uniref:Uncharacterized protein n=1 Tax=Hypholoma sublateritium (strain FD-334 SS-4) TaxID=945553 RepID=A0A0D2P2K8_HYPSF|nr:hypothetical protein HYPSUDRAFT_208404 [Hypholoma sublateritium FD-334 SS-4]
MRPVPNAPSAWKIVLMTAASPYRSCPPAVAVAHLHPAVGPECLHSPAILPVLPIPTAASLTPDGGSSLLLDHNAMFAFHPTNLPALAAHAPLPTHIPTSQIPRADTRAWATVPTPGLLDDNDEFSSSSLPTNISPPAPHAAPLGRGRCCGRVDPHSIFDVRLTARATTAPMLAP